MAGLVLPPDPGELVLAPDGDAPGRRAANKLANCASTAGWRVRVMKCPDGSDWNDVSSEVAA
jgi:DNA primase